jgi:hypothetical protein
MADSPVPSLSRAREQKISELSTFFANDDLSIEDLERRIERVYKAANMAELETITADLQTAAKPLDDYARAQMARATPNAPSSLELVSARVLSLLSSTRRVGRWAVPRHLDVVAIMSDTRIDLTEASLPPGIVDIELRAVMASFKLIVPPNTRVINETHSIMANVRSRADEFLPGDAPPSANAPVIRLTGFAMMADVNIVMRRREDRAYHDDDDYYFGK